MISSISERALEYAKYKGMTAADFERVCGLANGMLKKLSDKTRFQTYKRIGIAFPELNLTWLQTGTGDMLLNTSESDKPTLKDPDQLPKISSDPKISELLDIIKSQQETIQELVKRLPPQS